MINYDELVVGFEKLYNEWLIDAKKTENKAAQRRARKAAMEMIRNLREIRKASIKLQDE